MRGDKLLHPFAEDKALSALNSLMTQTGSFSQALGIEMDEKTVEHAPEWSEVVGGVVGDVAAGAADGAQQVDGAIAVGAAALDGAAGKAPLIFALPWRGERRRLARGWRTSTWARLPRICHSSSHLGGRCLVRLRMVCGLRSWETIHG